MPRGQSPLGISDDGRDGVLFVPASYRDTVPAPLLVMLHGYGGWADEMKSTFSLAEEFGVVVIAPESRDVTWGRESPGSTRTSATSARRTGKSRSWSTSTPRGSGWAAGPTAPATR